MHKKEGNGPKRGRRRTPGCPGGLPARPGGGARQGGAWTPWRSSPAPLRLRILLILQKLVIRNFYGGSRCFLTVLHTFSLFCFCWRLKQGCNMFFVSCCVYYIHINIDRVSCYVMFKSLPIHNLRFGAFKIVNLNCTRPINFFNMKWSFPPRK